MHAYAVDGLNLEQRQTFEERLNAPTPEAGDTRAKARQQREAQAALMAAISGARG